MKRFILSATHIDFFRQLGKVVGVGGWVGIHWDGMTPKCMRSFQRCWVGGIFELSFGRHLNEDLTLMSGEIFVENMDMKPRKNEMKNEWMMNESLYFVYMTLLDQHMTLADYSAMIALIYHSIKL